MVGVRRREQMFGKISAATERAKKVAGKAVAVAKTVNPIKSATAKKDKLKAKATGTVSYTHLTLPTTPYV